MRTTAFVALAALGLSAAGCGQHQSAVPAVGEASSAQNGDSRSPTYSQANAGDPRDAPVPKINGKPLWAPNRMHTAEENAKYQFARNGPDFGAASEADYVTKVHAFVEKPPQGVETVERGNGDRLLYDARDNIFAVVSRAGAPRTMFKPRDGATYWAEQKTRASEDDRGGSLGGSSGGSSGGNSRGYSGHYSGGYSGRYGGGSSGGYAGRGSGDSATAAGDQS